MGFRTVDRLTPLFAKHVEHRSVFATLHAHPFTTFARTPPIEADYPPTSLSPFAELALGEGTRCSTRYPANDSMNAASERSSRFRSDPSELSLRSRRTRRDPRWIREASTPIRLPITQTKFGTRMARLGCPRSERGRHARPCQGRMHRRACTIVFAFSGRERCPLARLRAVLRGAEAPSVDVALRAGSARFQMHDSCGNR